MAGGVLGFRVFGVVGFSVLGSEFKCLCVAVLSARFPDAQLVKRVED